MVDTCSVSASGPAGTVDPGRVVVVVLFVLSMLSAAGRGWLAVSSASPGFQTVAEIASSLLTIAFCALVVGAYLRRGPATGTDRTVAVWLAAPLATCLPFVIPALPTSVGGTTRSAIAFTMILIGTTWSVWAVRHLSTCLSVVPQARALVDTGPYRIVRHPLYLGEIIAVTGFAVRAGHPSHALVVLTLIALQAYRAHREEALLATHVPGYPAYMTHTWRIIPGIL